MCERKKQIRTKRRPPEFSGVECILIADFKNKSPVYLVDFEAQMWICFLLY